MKTYNQKHQLTEMLSDYLDGFVCRGITFHPARLITPAEGEAFPRNPRVEAAIQPVDGGRIIEVGAVGFLNRQDGRLNWSPSLPEPEAAKVSRERARLYNASAELARKLHEQGEDPLAYLRQENLISTDEEDQILLGDLGSTDFYRACDAVRSQYVTRVTEDGRSFESPLGVVGFVLALVGNHVAGEDGQLKLAEGDAIWGADADVQAIKALVDDWSAKSAERYDSTLPDGLETALHYLDGEDGFEPASSLKSVLGTMLGVDDFDAAPEAQARELLTNLRQRARSRGNQRETGERATAQAEVAEVPGT